MFQRVVSWLSNHLTDLKAIRDGLEDLQREIALSDQEKASAMQQRVGNLMQKIDIAGSNADTLHGEVKSRGHELDMIKEEESGQQLREADAENEAASRAALSQESSIGSGSDLPSTSEVSAPPMGDKIEGAGDGAGIGAGSGCS